MVNNITIDTIQQTIRQVNAILDEAGAVVRTGRTRPDVGQVPQDAPLSAMIDHTKLDIDAIAREIEMLCFEAKDFNFSSVCVFSGYVPLASEMLKDSDVTICAVIGHGSVLPQVIVYEAQEAIAVGAREIDMILPLGTLKSRDLISLFDDISDVVAVCHNHPDEIVCKVILQVDLLTDVEKVIACQIAKRAGADFVVSSTHYDAVVDVDDVALMRQVVGAGVGVKAVGLIKSLDDAITLRDAGANRLGTTHGVIIAREGQSTS